MTRQILLRFCDNWIVPGSDFSLNEEEIKTWEKMKVQEEEKSVR